MKEFNQRLNEIAKHYKIDSYADFAKELGISHQTASNYLKGNRVPNADALKQIIQKFDDLNAEWLLTGSGEMLKTKDQDFNSRKNDCITKREYNLLEENNQTLKNMVSILQDKIKDLKNQNSNFQENH